MENFVEKREYIYRFCGLEEILDYIRKGYLCSQHYNFVSLTNARLKDAARRFFNKKHKFVMVFNRPALYAQGLIEIEYNYQFLKEYPDIFEHIIDNFTNEDYESEEDAYGTAGYPEMQRAWNMLEANPDDRKTEDYFDEFMYDEFSEEKEFIVPYIQGIKGKLVTVLVHPDWAYDPDVDDGLQQITAELLKLKK